MTETPPPLENPVDPLEIFKQQLLTAALARLQLLLEDSELFSEMPLSSKFKIVQKYLIIHGPHSFTFQAYIDEDMDFETNTRFLKPTIFLLDIPNQRQGWGKRIVQTWEQALADAGFKGTIYLANVQSQSVGFWEKQGYRNVYMRGWLKEI